MPDLGRETGIKYGFNQKCEKGRPRQGEGLFPLRTERAGQDLEEGLRAGYERLEDSHPPCAGVLSVAGFSALPGPFPGRLRFILRGEEAYLCAERPSLLNNPGITVTHPAVYHAMKCTTGCTTGCT